MSIARSEPGLPSGSDSCTFLARFLRRPGRFCCADGAGFLRVGGMRHAGARRPCGRRPSWLWWRGAKTGTRNGRAAERRDDFLESRRICNVLRPYTANRTSKARLLLKSWMFPGTNWVSRDKSRVVKMFLEGTADRPVRTLDCGCGNAYFSLEAVRRGGRCLGITIHDWERQNCEEMRDFLGVDDEALEFRVNHLSELAADPAARGRFDQVLLLDVIEHIMDARETFRQT